MMREMTMISQRSLRCLVKLMRLVVPRALAWLRSSARKRSLCSWLRRRWGVSIGRGIFASGKQFDEIFLGFPASDPGRLCQESLAPGFRVLDVTCRRASPEVGRTGRGKPPARHRDRSGVATAGELLRQPVGYGGGVRHTSGICACTLLIRIWIASPSHWKCGGSPSISIDPRL